MIPETIPDSRYLVVQKDAKYIVSYGGGVNSTAMIIMLIKNKMPLDEVVFCDTGNEMPYTIEYLDIMRKYLYDHSIPFIIVEREDKESVAGESFRKKTVPSRIYKWCTRNHKISPIRKHYRKYKCHIFEYVGIDYSETGRMGPANVQYITKLYPLIDHKIKREGCENIIQDEGLPIPEKSGCYLCPFNSIEKWRRVLDDYPELYEEAMLIEETSKYPDRKLGPRNQKLRMFRDDLKFQTKLPFAEPEPECEGACMT